MELDFGDAPDGPYPTTLENDGARHIYNPDIFLGNLIDTENDGIQTPDALGDDNNNLDDEDGVVFLWPISAGSPCKIEVVASVNDAYFNGWIDFNGNGSWAEPEDHIFTDLVLMAGDNLLTFIAPPNVAPGAKFARFRYSTQPGLSYIGQAEDGEVEDYFVEVEQQTIELNGGWSGLSSYLVPIKPDIIEMFNPIIGNLEILFNQSGTYWPSQGVNTLGDWNEYSGYVIKVLEDDYLTIYGNEVLNKTVNIAAGWSLIPVLSKTDVDAINTFSTLTGFYLAKDVGGSGVLWPIFNINTLGNLETGKAYFVYSVSAGTITYPAGAENSSSRGHNSGASELPEKLGGTEEFVNISPWNDVCNTAATHIVAFAGGALSEFKTGDIIGTFTQSGLCAGIVEYSENGIGLVLNGDDVYTTYADGFVPNEMVSYSLYRPSTNQTFGLEVKYDPTLDNSGRFQVNSMSAVVQVKMSPTDIADYPGDKIYIYPNPSTGIFIINGIPGRAEISIYNTFGKQIYYEETNPPVQVGLTGQPNGIYIIKIITGTGTYYDKLILD